MNKLLTSMALLAVLSMTAANAATLTSVAGDAVSLTKSTVRVLVVTPVKKALGIVRTLVNGALDLSGNIVDEAADLVK